MFRRYLRDLGGLGKTGVQDQRVDTAVFPSHFFDRLPHIFGERGIGDNADRTMTDGSCRPFGIFASATGDEDHRSFGRKPLCNCQADTLGAPDNQGNLVTHPSHRKSFQLMVAA